MDEMKLPFTSIYRGTTMKRKFRTLAAGALIAAALSFTAHAATLNGPKYPAPNNNGFSSSGTNSGSAGGKTFNYSGFDTSAFDDLYWGPDENLLPGAGLDGALHTMTYDQTMGTTAYWQTTSSYTNPTTNATSTQTIWLAIDIFGLGSSPWISATSIGLPSSVGAVVDDSAGSNFSANLLFTVGASPGGTPINNLQQAPTTGCPDSNCRTQTAFTGAFYWTDPVAAVPEPASLALIGAGMVGFCAIRRPRNWPKAGQRLLQAIA
jgi:hypothetical protein